MRYLWAVLIGIILVSFTACQLFEDSDSQFDDAELVFSNSFEHFVWGDVIEISLELDDEDIESDDIESVLFYIDNEMMTNDMVYPFSYQWGAEQYQYGSHRIDAKIQMWNRELHVISEDVNLMPCMITENDIDDFKNITETDIQGNIIGSTDNDDWYNGFEYSFGPAYPNPVNDLAFIPLILTTPVEATIFVVDEDFEIVSVIFDEQHIVNGNHIMHWSVQDQPAGLYRIICHLSDDNHWHGDIMVSSSKEME